MVPAFPRFHVSPDRAASKFGDRRDGARHIRTEDARVTLAGMQVVVLDWFAASGRALAFRRATDPWAILVSEVIAQQTQAARAAEAWTRFMAEFPTPAALAAASPAAAIRAWRGLGYNRRALALRAAAIDIVGKFDGAVPDDLDALMSLPGVGPYTARAVLVFAFGRPVAALDVNIRRVVGRAFLDAELPARKMQAAADALVPDDHAAVWTHALMDIGAAFCRPQDPRCGACPLRALCRYAAASGPAAPRPTAQPRRPAARFPATSRWLRGRILDRLRDAPDDSWTTFDAAIGEHDSTAVLASLARLSTEGMIELDGIRARLGVSG